MENMLEQPNATVATLNFVLHCIGIDHASLHTNGTCLPINPTLLRIDAICFYKNLPGPHECLMRAEHSTYVY